MANLLVSGLDEDSKCIHEECHCQNPENHLDMLLDAASAFSFWTHLSYPLFQAKSSSPQFDMKAAKGQIIIQATYWIRYCHQEHPIKYSHQLIKADIPTAQHDLPVVQTVKNANYFRPEVVYMFKKMPLPSEVGLASSCRSWRARLITLCTSATHVMHKASWHDNMKYRQLVLAVSKHPQ